MELVDSIILVSRADSEPGHPDEAAGYSTTFEAKTIGVPLPKRLWISLLLWILVTLTSTLELQARPESDQEKYVLIHLDSVSSDYLAQEMKAGHLPNLSETFQNHGIIPEAITYFPSKTPTVINSLREGLSVAESTLVSWAGSHTASGKPASAFSTFSEMIRSKHRLAATNLVYGIPGLHWLGGLALSNLPDLIDDYKVLEFYWYPVDTAGHFYGEDAYLKRLRQFDRQFGRMVKRLDEDVNLIVYADHGMSFGEGIDTHGQIQESISGHYETVSYPNVYLNQPEQADSLSRVILEETEIDFVFFRSGESEVRGYHVGGEVQFLEIAGKIFYRFEGSDPFGYGQRGYKGQPLSPDEWLEFTYDMQYPVVPVNLINLLSNPAAGDIITLLDDDQFSQTFYSRRGNHGGVTRRDITVPVLLRGPELEWLYDRQTLWLPELFILLDDVPFGSRPAREEHTVSGRVEPASGHSAYSVELSPAYRWRLGAEALVSERFGSAAYQAWGEFDLLSSFLSRLWVGAGIETIRNGVVKPMALLRYDLRIRSLTARATLSTAGHHRFSLEWRMAEPVSLQVTDFKSVGLRLHF